MQFRKIIHIFIWLSSDFKKKSGKNTNDLDKSNIWTHASLYLLFSTFFWIEDSAGKSHQSIFSDHAKPSDMSKHVGSG